jgi:hypothetical protein
MNANCAAYLLDSKSYRGRDSARFFPSGLTRTVQAPELLPYLVANGLQHERNHASAGFRSSGVRLICVMRMAVIGR